MRVAPAFTLLALLGALPSANAALIAETGAAHDTFAGAQDLSGSFSKDFVDEIFNSTSYGHVTVRGGTGSANEIDFYKFFVSAAGIVGYFDIDGACQETTSNADNWVGCKTGTDTVLTLFNAVQQVLADGDDIEDDNFDPGSVTFYDAFLGSYQFRVAGWYYLAVTNYGNETDPEFPEADLLWRPDGGYGGLAYTKPGTFTWDSDGEYPDGGSYRLHVSLSPEPVPEPGTLALLGLGLASLAGARRRRPLTRRAARG